MTKWQSTLLGVVTVSIVLVPSVAAIPPESVSGTVTIVAAVVTSSRQPGPNTIITGENTLALDGDLSGTATFEFRQVTHSDGSTNVSGVVTCLCTIDAMRRGSTSCCAAADRIDSRWPATSERTDASDRRYRATTSVTTAKPAATATTPRAVRPAALDSSTSLAARALRAFLN